jgi:hypothetical protein
MKKILIKAVCLVLAMIVLSTQTFANSGTLGSLIDEAGLESVAGFDESEIYNVFAEVDELVSYLEQNGSVTYDDLKSVNSEWVENVSASATLAFGANSSEHPPIFSAFIWGCLFNWIGMLVVGVTTGFDGYHMRKSFWGCVVCTLLWGGTYGLTTYSGY